MMQKQDKVTQYIVTDRLQNINMRFRFRSYISRNKTTCVFITVNCSTIQ